MKRLSALLGLAGVMTMATPAEGQTQEFTEQSPPAPEAPPPSSQASPPAPTGPNPPAAPAGPTPVGPPVTAPVSAPQRDIQIHGFIGQGALKSTANNYLGQSKRGTLEFFEVGLNVSTEVTDRLRAGVQLYARDLGLLGNYSAKIDWAFLSYQWRQWAGLRAGRFKVPFGLYNEYSDIDSARPFVLLPQSVYPLRNRDFLLAHTGFLVYGSSPEGIAGALDYQLYLSTIYLDSFEDPGVVFMRNEYATGAQLFWRTPVEGLRLGGSFMHTNLERHEQLDDRAVAIIRTTGLVPADWDGLVHVTIPTINSWIGSAEYVGRGFLVAAEYGRHLAETRTSVPLLIPDFKTNAERAYAMVAYRFFDWLQVGSYYAVGFADANDRAGTKVDPVTGKPRFARPHQARQLDLALCLRFDVTNNWIVKLEGHYMNGTAGLKKDENPDPATMKEDWLFFALKTTLSF